MQYQARPPARRPFFACVLLFKDKLLVSHGWKTALKAAARRKTGGHSGSKSPLRKPFLPLPVVLEDPVLGTSMRLSLSHQVASGLIGVGSGETRGLFLVGWEGGIPAPDKSYAPDCTPCGERAIFPSTTDTETCEGLALRISSASGFSIRRCMTRLRGRAPKSAS